METSLNDMSGTNGLNEENLSSLKGMLHQLFHLEDKDLRTYSPLTLAYIGDGVYELVIRTILVKKGNCPVNQLHRKASSLVKAGTQSSMMEVIEPMLTEEEHSVYRRGRNAHSPLASAENYMDISMFCRSVRAGIHVHVVLPM